MSASADRMMRTFDAGARVKIRSSIAAKVSEFEPKSDGSSYIIGLGPW